LRGNARHGEEDRNSRHQTEAAKQHQRMAPRQHHEQQRGRRRQCHFADVAGEIVGAERLERARAGKGLGNE
jgi:hypothetical protein